MSFPIPYTRAQSAPAAVALLAALCTHTAALAQTPDNCILANPSFEVESPPGSASRWYRLGDTARVGPITHGIAAGKIRPQFTPGWNLSALWQPLDAAPGQVWTAAVDVLTPADEPLAGSTTAILNIEWRDAVGELISFESHTIADSATSIAQVARIQVVSQPAPAETVTTHLLIGVLQGPDAAPGSIIVDNVSFTAQTQQQADAQQWNDFPSGRQLTFADRVWRVKGPGLYGPGPNWFDNSTEQVDVDEAGNLHMRITGSNGGWSSSEIALVEALGYGDYRFTVQGRPDLWDPDVILGMFLWQYQSCYTQSATAWNAYNEIDVELARWGDPQANPAQFVVQPFDRNFNIIRFDPEFQSGPVSFAFDWQPDQVVFRAWRGALSDESPASTILAWPYAGAHIPRPEQPRVHINFWLRSGFSPIDLADHDAVISAFEFVAPNACVADLDGNGLIDCNDLFDFLAAFFSGETAGDVSNDGITNSIDFFLFLDLFFNGCQ